MDERTFQVYMELVLERYGNEAAKFVELLNPNKIKQFQLGES